MTQFGKTKHIHLVGIGGIGMSGIAELLINLGYVISGSDLKSTRVTRHLSDIGGRIFKGHSSDHVKDADVVVYSSAVGPENPEIKAARERYIPVIPRAEMLAELMRLKYGVAVAGAHGKTTTTSMVASILTRGGLDPTVVIGGRLDIWGGSNAKLGQGDILVAEADESDGSFLALSPTVAVVTNIDHEHLDYYGSMERIRETFLQFINKIPFYGTAVLCLDDPEIQGIIPELRKRYITYGMSTQADLRAVRLRKQRSGVRFEVTCHGESLGETTVGMPGEHNVLNALAAIGVALELEIDAQAVREGLEQLGGLGRRLQAKGEAQGVLVLDDYGHHPTEIVATLKTVKECWPERRLVVLFQPHRYSRTRDLLERFAVSFNQAEVLLVAPIYPAGESAVPGVTAERLVQEIKDHGHKEVLLCSRREDVVSTSLSLIRPGDVALTLGAGDIDTMGEELLEALRKAET